jgi:hypothetical protein
MSENSARRVIRLFPDYDRPSVAAVAEQHRRESDPLHNRARRLWADKVINSPVAHLVQRAEPVFTQVPLRNNQRPGREIGRLTARC